MQVLVKDEGRLCAVSPNRSLYAIVRKGLTVFVMDFIRRADELMDDPATPPLPVPRGRSRRPPSPLLCQHESLDEIQELQWSPDSSLLALLLGRRGCVEIVSVYGKFCVARIDAGCAGLRAVRWHPSSRAVFWVGLLQAHVFSLVDGCTKTLAGAVKFSAQLAAMQSWSEASAAVSMQKVLSAAALIRLSPCRQFVLYVVTPSMNSPLATEQRTKGEVPLHAQTSDKENNKSRNTDTGAGSGCLDSEIENEPRSSEWLVVLSSSTHEGLHAFPTRHLVQFVSDVIALRGGIALIDYVHGSLVVTTYNGAHVLYQEANGVQNVTASINYDMLLVLFKNSCRVIVVSEENMMMLRRISFEADVVTALRLREISLTDEPEPHEVSKSAVHSSASGSRVQSILYTTYRFSKKECTSNIRRCPQIQNTDGESAPPLEKGHGSISASGRMAAVSFSDFPHYVIIIDIFAQRVMAVLRHREDVTGFFWSPMSSSEYWSFQQRHYLDQKPTQPAARADKVTPGMEEPLFMTTNNHEGKAFLWLANYAVCFVVSLSADDKDTHFRKKSHHHGEVVLDKEAARYNDRLAFQVTRCIFGEHAATAVLVDDVRQIAATVVIQLSDVIR